MEKIEYLKNIYVDRINDENTVLEKVKIKENQYYFIPNLISINELYAVHAMYIDHNFDKAKLCFYKSACAFEYMVQTYDWRFMDTGIYNMINALLSDNKTIINRFCMLRNKNIDDTNMGFQVGNAAQNVILEDWKALENNIKNIERFLKFRQYQPITGVLDLFIGFIQHDEKLIKGGLMALLAARKQRNVDPLISKFFSVDTAGYSKLAWIKGYQIDLQSSFVPIELMPVRQLEVYTDYDFLKK